MPKDGSKILAIYKTENEALRKELENLQKENNNLKQQLVHKNDGLSDQEEICLEQLRLLNIESSQRALTLEETRKAEVLYKIYRDIKNIKKDPFDNSKIETEDLLKLVKNVPNE